jgi:hypothetical protein
MKNKQAYPKYLDALLTKTFYPETSSAHQKAKNYIESTNKKIEKGNSKTSSAKK